jgi:flagellar motor switch protein FliN
MADQETATDVKEPETAEAVDGAESIEETASVDPAEDAETQPAEGDDPAEDAETQPAEGDAADDPTSSADDEADEGQAETADDAAGVSDGEGVPPDDDDDVPPVSLDAFASMSPEVREELRRIMRLKVPVIVKLADKKLSLGDIIDLSPGSIVEFSRSADTPLELLVNNMTIGRGVAVKVGEKFGLRIDELSPVEETIRKLGG